MYTNNHILCQDLKIPHPVKGYTSFTRQETLAYIRFIMAYFLFDHNLFSGRPGTPYTLPSLINLG
jgi:hypothetical protein